MRVLHVATLVVGAIGIAIGLAMISVKSALDAWWMLAGIFGGGMLGLFLLGYLSRRTGNRAALAGVSAGVVVILWMSLSPKWTGALVAWKSPFHGFLTIVFGTLAVVLVGLLATTFFRRRPPAAP